MKIEDIKIKYTNLFIDGQFVPSSSGRKFETKNPANETIIATIAEADETDVNKAVKAAREAFDYGPWPRMSARSRSRILMKLSNLMRDNAEELAALEALDNGKTFENAKVDVEFALDQFAYFAGWADKYHGKTIPVDGDFFTYTINEPIGVCGAIIPWNFPLNMASWKLAPALALGNTMVLKVSEHTPLTALRLAKLIQEAGIPDGVVNILPGYGSTAGAALASHMDVDKIAFTGSTAVGQKVMAMAAASNLKPVTLELGGKSAAIVMNDCPNIDQAVEETHGALFMNQGQCCCAGSRLFVHSDIYEEFVDKMTERVKKAVVGEQFCPKTTQGPQVNDIQVKRIMRYIQLGKEQGARLTTGGNRFGDKGYFIEPTVFADVTDDMTISKEEIFGPVLCILKFDTVDEAIKRANKSSYGLAAGVWTKNIDIANKFSRALKAGTVWVNCYNQFDAASPFGGYKMSGIGREKGEYALKNYSQVKCVTTPLKDPAYL